MAAIPFRSVIGLFLFSGATALIYEVIWVRYLGMAFGSTTYSITTVLAAFMGGLALGSLWIGRFVDRPGQRPLRIYALLEAGIGLFGLASPWIFDLFVHVGPSLLPDAALENAEEGLAIKFAAGFLLLLLPTTLMGGSLPALSRFLIRHPDGIKRQLGMLYSVNTAGAVAGALLAGFLLLYTLGLTATLVWTALVNLAIAGIAWRLDRRYGVAAAEGDVADVGVQPDRFVGSRMRLVLYGAFLVSGGLAMMYEVLWSRLLVQVIGSSTYGFTMILIAFLIGLAGGSYLISRFIARERLNATLFAMLQAGIALGAFLLIPLLGWLPEAILAVFRAGYAEYWQVAGASFGLVLLLVLPATLCMGATFPVVAHMITKSEGSLGADIGRAYFFNTFGAILGTVAAGFVLIPLLGALPSMRLAIMANLLLSVAVVWAAVRLGHGIPRNRAVMATALSLLAFWPVWKSDFSSDLSAICVAVYGRDLAQDKDKEPLGGFRFEKEGVNARVSVRQAYDHRFLQVNGKADASTGPDMSTQLLLGLLPTLYHTNHGRAFMVGYGSGVTARVLAEERPDDRLDLAEIEGAVVEAGKYFEDINHRVESMANVRVIYNDARNFLSGSPQRYAMVISEPSNPWLAGIAGLFTHEFYRLVAEHLEEDDGIFVQWVQMYSLSPENTRMILRTMLDVFPYAEVWESIPGDLIVVASRRPLTLRSDWREQLTADAGRWGEYAERLWLTHPHELLAHRRGAVGQDVESLSERRNSDDVPHLEFTAPWSLYDDTVPENRLWLSRFFPEGEELEDAGLKAARARYLANGGILKEAMEHAEAAYHEAPQRRDVVITYASLALLQGQNDAVVRALTDDRWSRDEGEIPLLLAQAYIRRGDTELARMALLRVVDPEVLSDLHYQQWCEAAAALKLYDRLSLACRDREADGLVSYRTRHYLGLVAYRARQFAEAEQLFRESLELNPFNGITIAYLGHALWEQGFYRKAAEYYREYTARWGRSALIEKRLGIVNTLG